MRLVLVRQTTHVAALEHAAVGESIPLSGLKSADPAIGTAKPEEVFL